MLANVYGKNIRMELMTRDGNFTFLPSVITTAMPLLLRAPLQHKNLKEVQIVQKISYQARSHY